MEAQTVSEVDSMTLTGATVMVGHYPNGESELAVYVTEPVTPADAKIEAQNGNI